jgi:hypothetical protein
VTESDPSFGDRVLVEYPASEGFRSVGRLVLGGLASRFELPVDRMEDLLLAVESLLEHELASESVRLELEAASTGLLVRLGPFTKPPLDDPAVARVVTPLVHDATQRTNGVGTLVELLVPATYLGEA